MRVLGLITARGQSKGLPGKHLAFVAGKPLIAYTIEAALAARLDRLVLSTDDAAIARVGRNLGALVPFLRPAELAGDHSPHVDVLIHALLWLDEQDHYRPDYLLLLQPTSPLRTSDDIRNAIALAQAHDADSVVSVCPVVDHPLLTRRIDSGGTMANFVESDRKYLRRQDLPPAYVLNGAVYLTRRQVIVEQKTLHPSRTFPYVMPRNRSLQIDTPEDLEALTRLLSSQ